MTKHIVRCVVILGGIGWAAYLGELDDLFLTAVHVALGFILGVWIVLRDLKAELRSRQDYAIWLPTTDSPQRVYKVIEDVPEGSATDRGPGVGEPDRP